VLGFAFQPGVTMNFKRIEAASALLFFMAGLSSAAVAKGPNHSPTNSAEFSKTNSKPSSASPNTAEDSNIAQHVDAALKSDKVVRYEDIRVDTASGVVTLSGVVSSAFQSIRAQQIASTVDGVRAVNNHLMIIALSSAGSAK